MRGGTPHFVMGTGGTIVLGRHYIAASTIKSTVYGLVNTFVMGVGITNTSHDAGTRSLLRQTMAFWYRHLILDHHFGGTWPNHPSLRQRQAHLSFTVKHAHVPDMRTPEGLADVLALGCVLEFATPLRRDRYGRGYDASSDAVARDLEEENLARTWFRVIMKTFATKYFLVIKGAIIHASYIWEYVLVGFAAAVVTHMHNKMAAVELEEGRTAETVSDAFSWHLGQDYPHLVQPFMTALADTPARTSLTWNGPPIEIKRKTHAFYPIMRAAGFVEGVEWKGAPLHADGVSPRMNTYYKG